MAQCSGTVKALGGKQVLRAPLVKSILATLAKDSQDALVVASKFEVVGGTDTGRSLSPIRGDEYDTNFQLPFPVCNKLRNVCKDKVATQYL